MRILHVIAPGRVGGAEQVVLDLTRALARAGMEVHLAPILEDAEHPFRGAAEGSVKLHRVHLPRRAYLRERRTVRKLIREIRPGVVHTHGYRADVVDAPAARSEGIPTVTTVHGFTGGGMRNRLYEHVQRRALSRFDAVVAVSGPLALELRGDGLDPTRVHAIRNTRDAPAGLLSRREALRRLRLGAADFRVGWIGRISREKGLDLLFEALARLKDLDVRATVIGDGADRPWVARRAHELGISPGVEWAGVVPGAARHLAAFDLLVVSSRREGTPMTVLEAMAVGTPLVATRVGGIPAVLNEAEALLVPPESSESLAMAIRAVHAEPGAARARARRARDRFRAEGGTDRWADAYLRLYRAVGVPGARAAAVEWPQPAGCAGGAGS